MATVAQMDALGLRQTIREELDRSGLANLVRQLQADAGAATALPATALAGQEVYLQTAAMAALSPPLKWLLRYDGAKWLPVSAPAVTAFVAASESRSAATYAALGTPGPSLVVPATGDYIVRLCCDIALDNASITAGFMSFTIGASAAVDADAVRGGTFQTSSFSRDLPVKVALVAGTTLTAQYKSMNGSTNAYFINRRLALLPVRLG